MRDQAQRLRELFKSHESTASQTASERLPAITSLAKQTKSIAVTSGKGGVGKSSMALFLASTLSAMKKKVLLLDADLGLANVHILLGIAPQKTIAHVVEGGCTLNETIVSGIGGFEIIPGASGLEKLANLDIGRLEKLRQEFSRLESCYDILIIDTGAGIGTNVTQFAAKADVALVVMTPEPTSLADAYAMVKVLYDRGAHRVAVVVNMATSDRDGIETFDRLNALVVKFLKKPLDHFGTLLYNREVSRYVRKQQLLELEKNNEQLARRLHVISRRLIGQQRAEKTGFFGRFWSLSRETDA